MRKMSFKGERLQDVENVETKKTKPKKNDKDSDGSKFDGAGLNFKAKLIGHEVVPESKGDKMCQVSMAKLKAGALAMGEHKAKIIINLAHAGVSIYDEKQETVLQQHLVSQISFVSRDMNDSRAFGYVLSAKTEHTCTYIFWAFKTEKAADALMHCLKELFMVTAETAFGSPPDVASEAAKTMAADTVVSDEAAADQPDAVLESSNLIAAVDINTASPSNLISVEQDILSMSPGPAHPPSQSPPAFFVQQQQQKQLASSAPLTNLFNTPPSIHQPFQPPFNTHHPRTAPPSFTPMTSAFSNQPYYYQPTATHQFFSFPPSQAFNPFHAPQPYQHPMQQFQQPQQFHIPQPQQQQRQWTTFDHPQQQQQHPPTHDPFSSLPLRHSTTLRSTSSQPDFTGPLEEDLADELIENLGNITRAPAYPNGKLVTKEDFNKGPPVKPTLFALATQLNKANQAPQLPAHPFNSALKPPPRKSLRNDSISIEVTSDKSSSGSEQSRSDEAGRMIEEVVHMRARPFAVEPEVSSKAVVQTMLQKQNKHPVSIDLSGMRYSPFENKRDLSESTLVDWQGSPSKPPVELPSSNWNYKK